MKFIRLKNKYMSAMTRWHAIGDDGLSICGGWTPKDMPDRKCEETEKKPDRDLCVKCHRLIMDSYEKEKES